MDAAGFAGALPSTIEETGRRGDPGRGTAAGSPGAGPAADAAEAGLPQMSQR